MRRDWSQNPLLAADVVDPSTGDVVAEAGDTFDLERFDELKALRVREALVFTGGPRGESPLIKNTLAKDPTGGEAAALQSIYSLVRPGEAPNLKTARTALDRLFFNPKRYDLGRVGRHKVNQRLREVYRLLDFPLPAEDKTVLTPSDFVAILRYLVELHEGNGGVENGELAMIRRIANMVDRAVREIMVPRIDIVAVQSDATVEDVLHLVMERGYSRIPTYEENVDNIVGVVYAKDILRVLADGRRPESIQEIARPPYFIPEGKHIDELLAELREHKVHMAIVVDEYGGTAGLATIEDVLEEIVGEIQDEYDREEVTIERLTDSEAILDARVSLDALNELFDLHIEGEDVDTVGGFVYNLLGRMPNPGDEVHADGLALRVLSVLGRRIKKVRVTKEPVPADGEDGEDQEG